MVSRLVITRSTSRSVSPTDALAVALLIAATACGAGAGPQPAGAAAGGATPTLVLYGGDVRTMDLARPRATAIAIAGEDIVAIGSDAEIRTLAGPRTRLVALDGRTVTPGLIDAHCHLYGLGSDLDSVSVRDRASEAAAVAVLREAAAALPAGEPVIGRGWDHNRWPGGGWPTAASLDAALGDRPAYVERVDGHALWLNSAALAAAGITQATRDPAGGKLLRDARGAPTGVLIDAAMSLARPPAASAAVRERRIKAAAARAVAAGLTGVHEMGIDDATAAVYRTLAAADQLPLRVYAFRTGDPGDLASLRVAPAAAVGRFQLRGVKFFADGALGSRGARLHAPYEDEPDSRGLWVTPPEALRTAVEVAIGGGWQVATHAIGDAAVTSVLDAYLAAAKKHGGDTRPRIEHLQLVAPDDWPRLVESRAIASMQPTHATSDMAWAPARVGGDRLRGAYAWRKVLDLGVPLAAGSDFPVEDVSPLHGIYAAVTRQNAAGEPAGGWYPKQRISLDEALAAFTRVAAYAEGAEATRGTLSVGRAADLTVFDGRLHADRSLLERRVAMTIVAGRVVYERPAERGPQPVVAP